jgi:hypothetical protein
VKAELIVLALACGVFSHAMAEPQPIIENEVLFALVL